MFVKKGYRANGRIFLSIIKAYRETDTKKININELNAVKDKNDGYYSIVASELDMPEEEVIEKYRGLFRYFTKG